jgi:hypothetical protein
MPKTGLDGLPVIEVPDNEEITVAVKPGTYRKAASPNRNSARQIALRRQRGIDGARVSKREMLVRRGEEWFRYGKEQSTKPRVGGLESKVAWTLP